MKPKTSNSSLEVRLISQSLVLSQFVNWTYADLKDERCLLFVCTFIEPQALILDAALVLGSQA
jgi:hypothetical protein